MKKLIISLLSLSIAINVALCVKYDVYTSIKNKIIKPVETPPINYVIYDIQTSVYKEITYPEIVDLLFIGDSITDNCDYNNFIPNKIVVNQGINDDTTLGVLNRIDLAVKCNPKKIFINIGINDIRKYNQSTETIVANYSNIISSLSEKLPDSKIYIESILPVSGNLESEVLY